MTNQDAPIILAEFVYRGQRYQTIAWSHEFDVVRADDPFYWRGRETYSDTFYDMGLVEVWFGDDEAAS